MAAETAQHCLAIAAGFIGVVAACATLITSSNNKAESLANRIREIAKEYRKKQDEARCDQLTEQFKLLGMRFRRIQLAQQLLLATISFVIISFWIFICLGLFLTYGEEPVILMDYSILAIGALLTLATGLMIGAVWLKCSEIRMSYKTLCIEMSDCQGFDEEQWVVVAVGSRGISAGVLSNR